MSGLDDVEEKRRSSPAKVQSSKVLCEIEIRVAVSVGVGLNWKSKLAEPSASRENAELGDSLKSSKLEAPLPPPLAVARVTRIKSRLCSSDLTFGLILIRSGIVEAI